MQDERVPEHLRGDVMYAPSHHSGGGSTLRITARKTHSPDRLNHHHQIVIMAIMFITVIIEIEITFITL